MCVAVATDASDVPTARDRKKTLFRMLVLFTTLILSFPISTGGALCAKAEEGARAMPNLRHEGMLFAVAFSPGGKQLASANDQYINLWDVASGSLIRRWKGHGEQTFSLAFSPANEHELWSSGQDGLISVWNIVTGQRTAEIKGNGVKSIVFSSDGKLVLSSGEDGLLLRDARSKAIKRVFSKGSFRSGRFSSDGRSVFAIERASEKKEILPGSEELGEVATLQDKVGQWDTNSGILITIFPIKQALAFVLDTSTDSSRIVVSAYDSVRLYDSRSRTLIKELTDTPSSSARFLPNSDVVVTTELKLFDSVTGNLLGVLGDSGSEQSPYWLPSLLPGIGGLALLFHQVALPPLKPVIENTSEPLEQEHQPSAVAISPDGAIVAAADNERLRLWDVRTRQPIRSLGVPIVRPNVAFTIEEGVALSLDTGATKLFGKGSSLAVGDGTIRPGNDLVYVDNFFPDNRLRVKEVKNGLHFTVRDLRGYTNFSLSLDGRSLVASDLNGVLHLIDPITGVTKRSFGETSEQVPLVGYSAEASYAVAVYRNRVVLWNTATGDHLQDFDLPIALTMSDEDTHKLAGSVQFSNDGSHFLLENDGKLLLGSIPSGRIKYLSDEATSCGFSHSGGKILAEVGPKFMVWDTYSTKQDVYAGLEDVSCPVISNGGRYFMVSSATEPSTSVLRADSGEEMVKIFQYNRDGWAMTDSIGRFDAGDVGSVEGISWLMPDDPLRPLSPEIFMRDYYEPNLLGRLLACHEAEASGKNADACREGFKPVRPLGELNRIQPEVKFGGIRRGASADEVLVVVEVADKEDKTQKNGRTSTGVYDVRLFRDGQLVGQWPEPKEDAAVGDELDAWRRASRVVTADGKATYTFPVRLAGGDRGKKVTFTAYAFNEDRVKSATATDDSYTVPQDIAVPARPRAYVVTVGVNKYEKQSLRLNFAVADAEAIETALE
ncbi:MAG: hypothetical protein EOS21_32780, partial [Mesorhizobium sp.]